MGFDQYHEPPGELTRRGPDIRPDDHIVDRGGRGDRLVRAADGSGEGRAGAGDHADAQGEEFKHFGMDLEFLLRRNPKWRIAMKNVLFSEGDIVAAGERAEKAEQEAE